ncbi:hypothetical protein [Endozoicomonas sp. SCSIO W0465]|uniref:hypothetical protein n=1 Tax=Endozoicomonas sp. SCSIO W0465 TaxID=2918516 RepID=UPI0020751FD6|nr:hypothetical protein [Endozoicomonas sp. SCSIO W0465]USE38279.1 hypothetical protein MJO57_09000 [Endozoicomonas sp. SCSIO W0465]
MTIETVGTEADSVINALPVSFIREGITGQLPVQGERPEDEFQAIVQQMIELSGLINPQFASDSSSAADLPSTINSSTTAFAVTGGQQDIPTIEWLTSAGAAIPAAYSQPGWNSGLQQVLPEQPDQRQASPVSLTIKPAPVGAEATHTGQVVLPGVQQAMEPGSLQQSTQGSLQPLPKGILPNQETVAPESTVELPPPAHQESQTPTPPATTDVSDTSFNRLEPAIARQPSSVSQPNGLTAADPVKNCLMFGGDRHARAVAEFPGLGAVQVVMTRNNSEVTVNLQASKQSMPTLESCSSVLHQLVSDSIQQLHIHGNSVLKEAPVGSSAAESGLKIALSLTTPDHSGADRGRQYPFAGGLPGTSDFSDTDGSIAALAAQTSQEYRSSSALSRYPGTALIDLLI